MRNCEGLGNDAVMDRKRKAGLDESQVSRSMFQIKTRRLDVVASENSGNSSCQSVSSDQIFLASCCSINCESSELTKENSEFVDLEVQENVDLYATPAAGDSFDCQERRETTPSSEVEAESGELESTRRSNFRHRTMAKKIPSEAEIEDFFAAAEKNLQKQFIDKYNYDIVKDEPILEGRYEWLPIQIHADED